MWIVGLMSGTSADGIDAAVVEIEGRPPTAGGDGLRLTLRQHIHVSYNSALREDIFACFQPETGSVDRLCRVNFAIGEAFAAVALAVIKVAGLTPGAVDLIGSHGQTVWHIPPADDSGGATLQLGAGGVIAERTGITTVSDFRTRDMAAGGHGAPLVSYVDWLLFGHETKPRAAQNIGGIANVTYLPPGRHASAGSFAFDTGPGNMLIDYAAKRATDGEWSYDHEGQLAAVGRVDHELLAAWMKHPYFVGQPPKTTGRELFGSQFGAQLWAEAKSRGLADADVVATITALTAASIADAYRRFLPPLASVIVSGGGAENPTLMAMLREELSPIDAVPTDALGIPADAKEAVAFAVLAHETWHDRPGTLASCTGAEHATVLGSITPGANYGALLRGMVVGDED
jgi:anhydro-N-acetylmuramic acid kinase